MKIETPQIIQQTNYKKIVYFICLVGALGGLLFGLDQGFIANALINIKSVYDLGTSGAEKYSAILAVGGVIGALLSGVFARFLGSKKSLVLAGVIFYSRFTGFRLFAVFFSVAGVPVFLRIWCRSRLVYYPFIFIRNCSRFDSWLDGHFISVNDHHRYLFNFSD